MDPSSGLTPRLTLLFLLSTSPINFQKISLNVRSPFDESMSCHRDIATGYVWSQTKGTLAVKVSLHSIISVSLSFIIALLVS
ncbi:hypothetical protein BofuT4_uP120120.1 [Botrytis cinerea T4]|uniref:Uncharacterized protein n=1 Tax=Botryotinia fuckeliana (strain T4) TaxID=999810 RepID=G2XXW9_BOTF4|nr:hypothetical protein BofuT4_uP120120.1 [Botrytis cinerea T4]